MCSLILKKKVIQLLLLVPFFSVGLVLSNTDIFETEIRRLEKYTGGRIGVMAKNLGSGEIVSYRADEKFPTASVIKVPVMVEYFYQVKEGKLNPTQKIVLADSNKWGGSGLFQYFQGTTYQQLIDAVLMMITISDNTATNMVIDVLGKTHLEKLEAVNERMKKLGLKNTRLLNKLMSWETKTDSPESIRYGVGVSTPADMVNLLEQMATFQLVDSTSSKGMISILEKQEYNTIIPRLLPFEITPGLRVAHKSGSVTGVRNDVGLIHSSKANIALAIFIEQSLDRKSGPENEAYLAAAKISRLVWNYFTGNTGFKRTFVTSTDWNSFPGGEWTKVALRNSPYPHFSRENGYQYKEKMFPVDPHYSDSSAVIIIPDGFNETEDGTNLIVHFHGWNNDVLKVMEKFNMIQQLIRSQKNAILVLAQGPYRASDSGGGKMEDDGGLKRYVKEILELLQNEKRIQTIKLNKLIITAHSGGYRPAILSVANGGLQSQINEVYLFDAFYALTDQLIPWLTINKKNKLRSIYTDHLALEHKEFRRLLKKEGLKFSDKFSRKNQISLIHTNAGHSEVIEGTFFEWLKGSCLEEAK
ncbi:hypothetical protein B6I21_05430 [candidate division KSB1 bacterium 4572_119]|nr:MAG: hypothetical protein B6I21_05430 [candidate division KSB1 bacterium 4572_119]